MNSLISMLGRYPAQAQPIGSVSSLGNAGGGSGASLWRFDSGLGPLVLRAWPVDGPSQPILTRIHEWLARLTDLDFIPIPISTLDGRTYLPFESRYWEVTPWMPGIADPTSPPDLISLQAAFSGLAAVHERWSHQTRLGRSSALQSRLDEAESLLAIELKLMAFAVSHGSADPVRDLATRWLTLAADGLSQILTKLRRQVAAEVSIQPILRDPRPEHFLFEDNRLTGLVDFGAVGVDSPSADLARLLSEWVGTDLHARTVALDAYDKIRPLNLRQIELIDFFSETAAWLGPARWIRWHYLERRPFADPDAVKNGLSRSLNRLLERLSGVRSSEF